MIELDEEYAGRLISFAEDWASFYLNCGATTADEAVAALITASFAAGSVMSERAMTEIECSFFLKHYTAAILADRAA